ncbi:DUF2637 domain-containing protein [Streptomyces roseolus]|uniref:DUF2637 domain-containing protein n=1 Tax=Streptomyces roseolus TaxID=67358 RepID=UPI00379781AF
MSTAPAADSAAPGRVAAPRPRTEARWVHRALVAVALVAMPVVGIIGFAASYASLKKFAEAMGFGGLSWAFPIGIDASILGLLALDLVLVRIGRPMRLLRFAAHAMTLVTIWFNAANGLVDGPARSVWDGLAADPLRAASHAVMPVLFVLGVEALRHLLKTAGDIRTGRDRVPAHRWVLSPVRTARLYRRMRLANVTSYADMVQRELDLEGYRVWLTQELDGDLKKASDEQLLPMTMAPRGYTVEEALALPAKWRAEAEQRQLEEADRQAKAEAEEAERRAERAVQDAERRARLRAAEARAAAAGDMAEADAKADAAAARARAEEAQAVADGRAETARVLAGAETEAARVQAEQVRTKAERQAAIVAEAEESAELAAARARQAEADRVAAEEEARAETARRQAEEAAVQADRVAAERQRLEADRAAAERQRLEAVATAELLAADVAQRRAARAEAEAQAEAAEDFIRMSPRDRNIRRVARLLTAAHPVGTPAAEIDVKAVPLADIQERFSLGQSAASDLRADAKALLDGGYVPPVLNDPQAPYAL